MSSMVKIDYLKLHVSEKCTEIIKNKKNAIQTCLVIGNSYAQVLHAHLFKPVSAEITSRFAHVGQKSISAKLQ